MTSGKQYMKKKKLDSRNNFKKPNINPRHKVKTRCKSKHKSNRETQDLNNTEDPRYVIEHSIQWEENDLELGGGRVADLCKYTEKH